MGHRLPSPSPCHLLPISVALTLLGTSCPWNEIAVHFCVWLVSLITSSRYIYVLACARASSLSKVECYLVAWTHPSVLTQQSAARSLACSHLLAVGTNAVMNTGVQIPIRVPAFHFFVFIPRRGTAGASGDLGDLRTAVHSGSTPTSPPAAHGAPRSPQRILPLTIPGSLS